MRGTLHGPSQFGDISRFIPAGAGNTILEPVPHLLIAVYPRWRGEHGLPVGSASRYAGLSPLARGTLYSSSDLLLIMRFIPAGAGNTRAPTLSAGANQVYPRWRGEHEFDRPVTLGEGGLSPLARGTRTWHRRSSLINPVYPRWRGEHLRQRFNLLNHIGLSPLARGTQFAPRVTVDFVRFIPAGAGNTGWEISHNR